MAEEEGTIAVKLKVHYTFDAEHKVDHLCRPPQSFQIQTADLDDNLTIGVIDLRSCLDSVTGSSPELTNFHESDYTVYAYDYSEPNTPLVGQGMLSKVLSQDPSLSEAMVTGKITQNVMAKFKKNVEPFLEVKLRLTPISSSIQRGRSGSVSSVNESMQSQWSGSFSSGPMSHERPQSPADMSRLDNVQRSLLEGSQRRDSSAWYAGSRPSSRPGTPTQSHQYMPPQPGSTHSRHGSQYVPYQNSHQRRGSESGYWTGDEAFEEGPARKRAKTTQVKRVKKDDFNIEQQASSLRTAAMSASSVRLHQPVPMNPAAALQRGMPTEEPVRPPTPMAHARDKKPGARPRGRPPKARVVESIEPSSPTPHHVHPPQPPSNVSSPEETRALSRHEPYFPSSPPVLNHPQSTSPNLPAPTLPNGFPSADANHDSGFFSAQLESAHEAGYPVNADDAQPDFFEPNDINDVDFSAFLDPAYSMQDIQDLDLTQAGEGQAAANHYTPVFDDESTFEGPTPQPEAGLHQLTEPSPLPEPQKIPKPMLRQSSSEKESNKENGFQRPPPPSQIMNKQPPATDKNGRPVPMLLPRPPAPSMPPATLQRSQSALPPVPASDPVGRPFHRSATWTPDMSDMIMSDSGVPGEAKKARKRVGKEQTKARLETAIATGSMPPYCENCGTIETPAWRRGFIKDYDAQAFPMDDFPTSLSPGEMCYKEVTVRHADQTAKTWRGWKIEKSGNAPDVGWKQINLCNPCGLWFHKTKVPRPPEKWQKKEPKEKRKRKRPPKPPKSRTQPRRSAAGHLASDAPESDAPEPGSEDSSPADTSIEDGPDDNNDAMTVDGCNETETQEPDLPQMPKSMSAQLDRRTVMFADVQERRVQSSPVLRGTAAEPIDIDLTPKPIRRTLWPSRGKGQLSPDKESPLRPKQNEELLPSFGRRSPRLNKTRDVLAEMGASAMTTVDGDVLAGDKENFTPRTRALFEDLPDYFLDVHDDAMPAPVTPTPKRRSERLFTKTPQTARTPSREFGAEVSGNVQTTPRRPPKTPNSKTPRVNLSAIFLDTVVRNQPPEMMTPYTRELAGHCSGISSPMSRGSRGRTGFTPRGATPGSKDMAFGFPDLPSLHESSPSSQPNWDALISELATDKLYSDTLEHTFDGNQLLPSSPPTSDWDEKFGGMVSFDQHDKEDWAHSDKDYGASSSKLRTPRKQGGNGMLDVTTPDHVGLRRSPRRVGNQ